MHDAFPARPSWRLLLFLVIGLCLSHGVAADDAIADPLRAPRTHHVKKGDTLSGISHTHGVAVDVIRKLNGIKGDRIRPGQVLKLRKSQAKASTPKKSRKPRSSTKKKKKKNKKSSGKWTRGCDYTVKKGDYLGRIAKKRKTTVKALLRLNGKRKSRRLRPGDHLRVCHLEPGGGPHILKDGVSLPSTGVGFIAPRRKRVWGTPHTVSAIMTACADLARKYPGTAPIYVGDLSFKNGGYMPPHKSHRVGIDADIGYFFKGNDGKDWFATPPNSKFDAEKTLALLESFIATGQVHQFYIDYRLQRRLYREARRQGYKKADLHRMFEYPDKRGSGRSRLIRHLRGHDHHFHVRFVKSPREAPQAEPGPDELGPGEDATQGLRESSNNPPPESPEGGAQSSPPPE